VVRYGEPAIFSIETFLMKPSMWSV